MRLGIARVLVALVATTAIWIPCASAFAFDETTATTPPSTDPSCGVCHHPGQTSVSGLRYGPHGGYLSTTHACDTCHTLHDAPTGNALLPGSTIRATCLTCHDGTAALGEGVYGAIVGRGEVVGGGHSIDTTNVVPGGNASSGGSSVGAYSGVDGTLTCSDCHSPHGSNCVTPFLGERQRSYRFLRDFHGLLTVQTQNRLLKQRPGNATTATTEYGSDWCLGCHAGRASGLPTAHNHPVESTLTAGAGAYNYRSLGIIAAVAYPTSQTVLGPAGINTKSTSVFNRAYLMPYPRTGAQAGHLPICQQCHEDTRYVGTLSADGTQATPSTATVTSPDGRVVSDNPRFQNFPHETTGYRMLVESTTTAYTDDLCLNCHPLAQLP